MVKRHAIASNEWIDHSIPPAPATKAGTGQAGSTPVVRIANGLLAAALLHIHPPAAPINPKSASMQLQPPSSAAVGSFLLVFCGYVVVSYALRVRFPF